MLLIVRSEYCAVYNADVISGIAHTVAFVQMVAFGVFSGSSPSVNKTIKALCATLVENLATNCSTPLK